MKVKVHLEHSKYRTEGTIELVDECELNDTSLSYLLKHCEGIGPTATLRLIQFFKDNRIKLIENAREV